MVWNIGCFTEKGEGYVKIVKSKTKVISLLIVLIFFLAIINLNYDAFLKLKKIKLITSQKNRYVALQFNYPVKNILAKAKVHKINDSLGWIGEEKHKIDFLGSYIVKILIYDIDVADKLRNMDKELISGKLGVVSLSSNIKYMITFPPDDCLTAIYIGSNKHNLSESLVTLYGFKRALLLKLKD